ncbi:TadE/TadG family type IV pilus assembly protein [Nocardioides baculatus]|uniref:Pilus assembly protein n=1 Tax=Nocardioides baculatus TaxID=2801337 RepID=A0ABS1L7T1_9ACTN|nr:TadE/TadG family type IV pilus assembly protein [Nocardioides baculatus]MBL0747478.1 pilus assembly protein [Nocardioides baculatus]
MRWRTSRNTRDERGASAVEFALVVVPLLMVIAGIINFGVVFAQQLALDNAVRAGARAGVVDTGKNLTTETTNQWDSTAIAKSQTSGFAVTFPTNTGGVGTTCKGSTYGKNMVVRGEVTSKFLFPWPLPGMGQTITLSSQAEFQCEYQ